MDTGLDMITKTGPGSPWEFLGRKDFQWMYIRIVIVPITHQIRVD